MTTKKAAVFKDLRNYWFLASLAMTPVALALYSIRRKKNEKNIIIIGDTFVDIIACTDELPSWETDTVIEKPLKLMLGGSGANTACHLTNAIKQNFNKAGAKIWPISAQNLQCRLITAIGSGPFGEFARNALKQRCVRIDHTLKKVRGEQGSCVVITGRGKRGFLTYRGASGAFDGSNFNLDFVRRGDHVHVAGFFNMESLINDLPKILKEARTRGATLSLTPQYDASEKWGGLDKIYPLLAHLILNETEAMKLASSIENAGAAEYFLRKGVENVVITRGELGASLYRFNRSKDVVDFHQKCRSVDSVDSTGAGDAFSAGFLLFWMIHRNFELALQWGCAYGTAAVQIIGGSSTEPFLPKDLEKLVMT